MLSLCSHSPAPSSSVGTTTHETACHALANRCDGPLAFRAQSVQLSERLAFFRAVRRCGGGRTETMKTWKPRRVFRAAFVVVAVGVLAAGCLGPGRPSGRTPCDQHCAAWSLAHPRRRRVATGSALSGYGGTLGEIIANDFSIGGPRYVEIKPTDVGVQPAGLHELLPDLAARPVDDAADPAGRTVWRRGLEGQL